MHCTTNMAAPLNNKPDCWRSPEVYKHHEQQKVCISRPKYREGRKAKAVKVYTVNLESRYLMVQGVPAIGVMTELIQLCALYGTVEEYRPLDEYPAEEFTEVYLVKFQRLPSARAAKRNMDEKSFYGSVLHVCYVPEYETVEDTRLKLQDRRSFIARAARNRAKEKEKTDAVQESPASSVKIPARHEETFENKNTRDASAPSHYSEFPPLPLPPQELKNSYRQKNHSGIVQKEDKMGTLHNAISNVEQQELESFGSNPTASKSDQGPEGRLFTPRVAHLENRKRKIEESNESAVNVSGENEPFIGPKLPEQPKLDMEDDSLNTTLNLIRSTMKQVGSAPDIRPIQKKAKPRRRI
ncbi:RNA-binding protein 48 [Cyprinodon tularosa]|uniref:RNA-binding protein 48 n=1 Tax=Cyprinodon tularosa TaxID=77115 RepID=UPI0018E280B7|nr:RNA-binding protein 48 [Cyprinodon tularosa]